MASDAERIFATTKQRSVAELPGSVEEAAMEEVEGMEGEEKAEEIAQRERSEQKQGVIDGKEEVGEVACNPTRGKTMKCFDCATEVEYEFAAGMLHCYKHWERGHLFECPLCDYSTNGGMIPVKEHIGEKHPEQAASAKPRSREMDHRTELRLLFKHCFAGWKRHSALLEAPEEFGCQFCRRLFRTPRGLAVHRSRCREAPRESLSDGIQTAKPKGTSNRGRSLKRASDSPFTQMAKTSRVTKVLQTEQRSVEKLPENVEEAAMEEGEGMKGEEKAEEIVRREKSEQQQGVMDGKEEVGEVACNPTRGKKIKCFDCGTEVEYEVMAGKLHCYKQHWELSDLFECPLCAYSTNDGKIRVAEHIREKHPAQAASAKPRSLERDYKPEIERLFNHCFAGCEQHPAQLDMMQRFLVSLAENVEEAAMEEAEGMEGEEEAEERAQRERTEQQQGVMEIKEEVGEMEYEITAGKLPRYRHSSTGHLFQCPLCQYSTNDGLNRLMEHVREKHQLEEQTTSEPSKVKKEEEAAAGY